jgi:hypothetical protein
MGEKELRRFAAWVIERCGEDERRLLENDRS